MGILEIGIKLTFLQNIIGICIYCFKEEQCAIYDSLSLNGMFKIPVISLKNIVITSY